MRLKIICAKCNSLLDPDQEQHSYMVPIAQCFDLSYSATLECPTCKVQVIIDMEAITQS